jgi:hypothetical protein
MRYCRPWTTALPVGLRFGYGSEKPQPQPELSGRHRGLIGETASMDTPTTQLVEPSSQRWEAAIKPLVLSWASLLLGLLSLVLIPILLWGTARCLWRRARGPLLVLLVFNPMGVSFVNGVIDYLSGSPQYHAVGLLRVSNPDRTTRCTTTTSGCVMWGHEWATMGPHNLGIYLMAVVFGPPRGVYDGPYPTEEEALRWVREAAPTPTDVFLSGKVQVNGQEALLGQESLSRMLARTSYYQCQMENRPIPELKVRAVLHEGRCLIVRLDETVPRLDNTTGTFTSTVLVLADARNLKPFAFYRPLFGHATD